MKIYATSLLFALLIATSASAFSVPSNVPFDSKEAKLKACLLTEAQQAIEKGSLTKDNIDKQAAQLAAVCATQVSTTKNDTTVQLATAVIKELLK